MADTPSVLFISCCDVKPDEIIKLILDVNELPDKIQIEEGIHAFPWHIDNKYYDADLNLCSLERKTISNQKFSDTVEAVVLQFDSSKNDALDKVESWLPFINEYAPEIKILLCNNVKADDNESFRKRTIQEWCIDRGFELVELEPIVDEVNDEVEDDFHETTGIKRIIQALNAHVWPNLVMKTTSQNKSRTLNSTVNNCHPELNVLKEQLCLEESLEELLENDDDFSQLFSQLPEMKARVASLSGDDRKGAAEQVVRAFWKALGGDDEEEFLNL